MSIFKIRIITIVLLALPFYCFSQNDLIIKIPTSDLKGKVLLGLFNGPNLYLESEGMYRHCVEEVKDSMTTCLIKDLPQGNYSIALLVDLNENEEMDFTWFGWPKESYGFYPDPGFLMRKPKWEECNFRLEQDMEIEIRIR